MPAHALNLNPVWSHYADVCRPSSLEYLGNAGGFSGARLWRAETNAGPMCLRAWPKEFRGHRPLRFMHDVLLCVRAAGLRFVPAPLRARDGCTFVRHTGCFWEVTPWMPGTADFQRRPTVVRLRAAMQALARFHLAAAAAHHIDPIGPSPTLQRRLRELHLFLNGSAATELRRRVPDGRWPEMDERAQRLLGHVQARRGFLDELIERPLEPVTQQPVIRDIWHDHVLFQRDAVSGIIDFGAMSVDTVAVDVARLLGSLVGGDRVACAEALRAYSEIRPLSMPQRELLETLDQTGVFAGGLVWLRWHYLEHRTFENRAGVLARVDHFLKRLETVSDLPRRHRRILHTVA